MTEASNTSELAASAGSRRLHRDHRAKRTIEDIFRAQGIVPGTRPEPIPDLMSDEEHAEFLAWLRVIRGHGDEG